MPKKIVIKAQMNCEKCRAKARKIAAGSNGVNSLAIQGADKNQVVVTGDGIDSVTLTQKLRKEFGFAMIESVQEEKAQEQPKPPQPKKPDQPPSITYHPFWHGPTPTYHEVVVCEPNPSPCSIL